MLVDYPTIAERLDNLREAGTGWKARCPCPEHEDKRNSLSLSVGDDGRLLVRCHRGCTFDAIAEALGVEQRDFFPPHPAEQDNGHSKLGRIVAKYDYCDEEGELLFQTVRLDPKGFRQRIPDGNGGWKWKLNGVRRVPFRLPELLASGKRQTVFIVEGEKDVDRLRGLGLVATCNAAGADKWRPEFSDHLDGRTVVILPDNDPAGRTHAEQVAASLSGLAESVKVVTLPGLPDKGDVSDWFDQGGSKDGLLTLCENTPEWTPAAATVAESNGRLTPNEDVDDPHRLARLCLKELPIVRYWRQEFYSFDSPAYCALSVDELRSMVAVIVKAEFDRVNIEAQEVGAADRKSNPPKSRKVTRNLLANVVEVIQSLTIIPNRSELPLWIDGQPAPCPPPEECLVTESGILHVPSLATEKSLLIDPTPCLFTTNSVDYGFDPQAECPRWLAFLSDLWPADSDEICTLQEIFGYLLLPDTSLQKMFLLIGPKRSGKGTIARVMRAVVGPDNVCAPVLGSLQGDFGLQPLLGKTVALVGDARLSGRSDAAVIVERLLSITGEDPQTVGRKHMPSVTTQLKARFVLLSNELPTLRDASATLPSRVILLRFTKSFYDRENHKLTDQLLEERPGILRWALDGWLRLEARGYLVQPEMSRELIESMEELSSPITSFVRQCCEVGAGFQISVTDLFTEWKTWCEEKGRKPGSEQMLGRDLRAAVPSIRVTQPREDGKRVRCYEGLQIRGV
jgi:P4 family phage/plasmid primase-like protien